MKCKFTFKHLQPLESITQYSENRVSKIEKFNMHKEMNVHFIFSVQRADQVAEIIVDSGKLHFTAIAKDPTLYAAIDKVVDKLETQLAKHKDKVVHHHDYDHSKEGMLDHELAAQVKEAKLRRAYQIDTMNDDLGVFDIGSKNN